MCFKDCFRYAAYNMGLIRFRKAKDTQNDEEYTKSERNDSTSVSIPDDVNVKVEEKDEDNNIIVVVPEAPTEEDDTKKGSTEESNETEEDKTTKDEENIAEDAQPAELPKAVDTVSVTVTVTEDDDDESDEEIDLTAGVENKGDDKDDKGATDDTPIEPESDEKKPVVVDGIVLDDIITEIEKADTPKVEESNDGKVTSQFSITDDELEKIAQSTFDYSYTKFGEETGKE